MTNPDAKNASQAEVNTRVRINYVWGGNYLSQVGSYSAGGVSFDTVQILPTPEYASSGLAIGDEWIE